MQQVKLAVSGMTCGGCARHVESAIKGAVQAQQVTVDLATGTVVIDGDFPQGVTPVLDALQAEGYPATVTTQATAASKPQGGSCQSGGGCCCH